jgi:hypothetical protein
MRAVDFFSFLVFFSSLLSMSSISSAHDVGEPLLEQHPTWSRCCAGQDCTAQKVKIVGPEVREKVSVEIEGTQTRVDKAKLSKVPSAHTWVCYVDPKGGVNNDNIRCILFPENRGTVHGPKPLPIQRQNIRASARERPQ